jgi:hypothetical protein
LEEEEVTRPKRLTEMTRAEYQEHLAARKQRVA